MLRLYRRKIIYLFLTTAFMTVINLLVLLLSGVWLDLTPKLDWQPPMDYILAGGILGALLYRLHLVRRRRRIAKKANTRALHINSGLHPYGRGELIKQ